MYKQLIFTAFILFILIFTLRQLSKKPWFSLFVSPVTTLDKGQKIIALTFDDGPSATLTPPLLNLLKKHQIHATFFVNGNRLKQFPEIGKRIVREGHHLGNHTYKHDRMVWKSKDFIKKDLLKTDSLIRWCGQQDVSLFRPSFGDKFIILPLVLKSMKKQMVTWSANPAAQYEPELDAEKIISQTLEQTTSGSIILLHDGWTVSNQEFLESVEQIITKLKNQGYSFTVL